MKNKQNKKTLLRQPYSVFNPVFLACTLFGLGKIPFAPGSIGSAIAALEFLFYIKIDANYSLYYINLIIAFPIIWYCVYSYINRVRKEDPKEVIIDEYYGQHIAQLLSFFLISRFSDSSISIYYVILISYIFFRIFDIFKPSLVGYIDKNYKNALGVMLDDVVAGLLAVIPTFIVLYLISYIN